MSLSRPGSHCPACDTPIAWHDNVPIVSWLVLRGRCRHCRVPISPRYLLLELATGLAFLLLFHLEVALGGANLPGLRLAAAEGSVLRPAAALIAMCLYHVVLASGAFCGSLIALGGRRPPLRLGLFLLGCGLLAPLLLAPLLPVAAFDFARPAATWLTVGKPDADGPTAPQLAVGIFPAGLLTALAGAAVGGVVGSGLTILGRRWPPAATEQTDSPKADRWGAAFLLAAAGACLGWQAALGVAVAVALLAVATRALTKKTSLPLDLLAAAYLAPVLLALLTTWRWLAEFVASRPG